MGLLGSRQHFSIDRCGVQFETKRLRSGDEATGNYFMDTTETFRLVPGGNPASEKCDTTHMRHSCESGLTSLGPSSMAPSTMPLKEKGLGNRPIMDSVASSVMPFLVIVKSVHPTFLVSFTSAVAQQFSLNSFNQVLEQHVFGAGVECQGCPGVCRPGILSVALQ